MSESEDDSTAVLTPTKQLERLRTYGNSSTRRCGKSPLFKTRSRILALRKKAKGNKEALAKLKTALAVVAKKREQAIGS